MPPRRTPRAHDGGAGNPPPPAATKECKFFKQQGSCRFGRNCKFLHLARIEAPAAGGSATVNGQEPPESTVTLDAQILHEGVEEVAAPAHGTPAGTVVILDSEPATSASSPLAPNPIGGQPFLDLRVHLPQRTWGEVSTLHEESPSSSPSTSTLALPATPNGGETRARPAVNKPCFAWQKGHCWRGDKCLFRHDGERQQQHQQQNAVQRRAAMDERRRIAQEREQHRREAEEQQRREDARRREEEEERRRELERLERERLERIARERAAEEARRAEIDRARAAAEERRRREREAREERERIKLEQIKRRAAEDRQREAKVTRQLLVQGSNLVTFGPGFEVKRVIPGFDLCKITIRKLPLDATRHEICNLFREQGMDETMFHVVSDNRTEGNFKVAEFLMRTEEAKVMAVGLDGLEFRDNLLEFEVGANASWGSMTSSTANQPKTLTILWSRPSVAMIATYNSVEEARIQAREMDNKMIGGRKISAIMNARPNGAAARHWVEASVRIGGLNPETTDIEVSGISGTYLLRRIKSTVYDFDAFVEGMKGTVEREGCMAGTFHTISLDTIRMKTTAQFPNHESLARAEAALNRGVALPGFTRPYLRIIAPAEHQYTISISVAQYRAQKAQWDEMTEGARGKKAFVRVNEKRNGVVFINVHGSEQQEIGPLKVRVEGLVAGERLDNEHWHNTFMFQGKALFDRILAETGVFVLVDRRMHGLRLFGRSNSLAAAKDMVKEEVGRLELLEWDIPISRHSIRFFVATGLNILKEELGEDNVTLDVAGCKIKLRGGDDAIHQARKLVAEAAIAAQTGQQLGQDVEEGALCPICYDTPSHPVILSCNHSCCEACLRHYLTSAATSDKFPLVCMGDEATCNTPISIPIIDRYLTKQRYTQFIDTVFSSHIKSNPRKFKYCTTPDCSQIYQCDTNQQFHQCPSCFSKICSACNEEAHEGMTCEERRIQSDPAEQDRLNNEWAQANNIKRCPSCSVLMEKTEGCNHMTCPCGAHFCWSCRGVFTAATIYEHMNTAHGGMFEQDPAPAPALPARPPAFPARVQHDPLNAFREQRAAEQRAQDAAWEAIVRRQRLEQTIRLQRERDEQRQREQVEEARRRGRQQHAMRQERAMQEVARAEAESKKGGMCTIM